MGACGAERASGATGYLTEKEVALMRRLIMVLSVALMMALMMAVAGAASATVHPQMNSERSNAPEGTAAATQDPPGISGRSNADNVAQPILKQLSNSTSNDCNAWKEFQEFCQ